MDDKGLRSVVPVKDPEVGERPFMDLSSGYIQRSLDIMPKSAVSYPWRLNQEYVSDRKIMRRSDVEDGVLAFRQPSGQDAKSQDELQAAE